MLVVGRDEGPTGARGPVMHEDRRYGEVMPHPLFAEPHDDQTVHLCRREGVDRLHLAPLDPGAVREQRDRVPPSDLHHQGAVEFCVVRDGRVRSEHTREPGPPSAQPAGEAVRPVAELPRGVEHLLARLVGNRTRSVIEDVADDGDRKPGAAGDVGAGHGHDGLPAGFRVADRHDRRGPPEPHPMFVIGRSCLVPAGERQRRRAIRVAAPHLTASRRPEEYERPRSRPHPPRAPPCGHRALPVIPGRRSRRDPHDDQEHGRRDRQLPAPMRV